MLSLLAAAWLVPGPCWAEQVVAVLAFGGDDEGNVRGAVVDPLFNRYTIIHGDKVLDACDELGIPMSRGRNLARCARRAGVVAVVGGAVQGGKLSLVVFSGGNGQVLAKGAVPCRGRLSRRNVRRALAIIRKGMRKAPRRVAGARRARPGPKPSNPMSFDPEPVGRGSGDPPSGQTEDLDEDPLTGAGTPTFDPDAPDPTPGNEPHPRAEQDPDAVLTGTSNPALEITLGGGVWSRSFSYNDPIQTFRTSGGKKEELKSLPYSSGAAFLLRVAARVRPLGFFKKGLAAGPFVKLMFQSTAGLSTRARGKNPTTGQTEDQLLGTAFWGLDLEAGYDWDIFGDNGLGPRLLLSLGFSTLDFNIDWPTEATALAQTNGRLPNVNYKCLLLKLGVAYNFVNMADDLFTLGGHLFFDYRPVLGDVGEIEDETLWYGPASVGGLNLALGLDGRVNISPRVKLVISLEYTYTRYWYAFDEAAARIEQSKNQGESLRVAGGALDELHGFVVNVGYAL